MLAASRSGCGRCGAAWPRERCGRCSLKCRWYSVTSRRPRERFEDEDPVQQLPRRLPRNRSRMPAFAWGHPYRRGSGSACQPSSKSCRGTGTTRRRRPRSITRLRACWASHSPVGCAARRGSALGIYSHARRRRDRASDMKGLRTEQVTGEDPAGLRLQELAPRSDRTAAAPGPSPAAVRIRPHRRGPNRIAQARPLAMDTPISPRFSLAKPHDQTRRPAATGGRPGRGASWWSTGGSPPPMPTENGLRRDQHPDTAWPGEDGGPTQGRPQSTHDNRGLHLRRRSTIWVPQHQDLGILRRLRTEPAAPSSPPAGT